MVEIWGGVRSLVKEGHSRKIWGAFMGLGSQYIQDFNWLGMLRDLGQVESPSESGQVCFRDLLLFFF